MRPPGKMTDIPQLRVTVYRLKDATAELYPAINGSIGEFQLGESQLVSAAYNWDLFDDVRAVLTSSAAIEAFDRFTATFVASAPPRHRTPDALLQAVTEMRAAVSDDQWTIVGTDDYALLLHSFLNHLEVVACTYRGFTDVFVVIQ